MQPRVSKRERKLHLSYELPHRIHCSHIYPITAPNGSTVIIYGHDRGLRILWHGGRRRRDPQTAPSKTSGTQQTDVILIDDNEEPAHEFEEEELDPDCPYADTIQDLDIIIDHEDDERPVKRSILHTAAANLQNSALTPAVLKTVAVVAMASSDGAIRILQIPLAPPKDEEKDEVLSNIFESQIELCASGPITSSLAIKFLPVDNQPLTAPKRQEGVDGHLLVAAASRALSIWAVPVTAESLFIEDQSPITKVQLPSPLANISFHPSTRSTQLLVADRLGAARIYDPYALKTPQRRPNSSGSSIEAVPSTSGPGKWVMTYHTSYPLPKDGSVPSALAHRKKILDAKWILGGKGIVALLEDSQWGIWDVSGSPRPGKRIEDFAIDGFLSAPSANESAEPTRPKRGSSKLAPMTPNTRKTKSEQFYGAESKSKAHETVPKGGVSVASNHPRSGQTDESVTMWYNSDVYSIPSVASFWQRSSTTGGGIGSLYAPGVSHVAEVNTMREMISSISHFGAKSSSAGIGTMNTQRDLLISTEYHLIVLQQLRPPTPSRSLFQAVERPTSRDQQMLDAGTLDLAGMDRVLDGMASGIAPGRKVGFAN